MALTRFKRTLKLARLSVRQLTHTLHLPPAQAEIYDGPHAEWLRDVLEALPNLQSLIVSRLPFFDHQALLVLRSYSNGRRQSSDESGPDFALRLLIAAQCKNMTSSSLAEALKHFSSLAYVDLSNNVSARDPSVLAQLQYMSYLQVLRLRNCQLRDSDMEVLAASIGLCVRSLDVRGNRLTDASVRTLLQHCFDVTERSNRSLGSRPRASSGAVIEDWADWPSGIARPDAKILDEFRDESLNEHFVRRLTAGIVTRLPSQDLQHAGITHLYVAENHLSVEGVASLIKSKQLYVLDVGNFDTSKILNQPRGLSSSSSPTSRGHRIFLPGAEKLAPVLEECGKNLTYLRLHHSVVTKASPTKDENTPSRATELEGNNHRQELDSAIRTFELPTDDPVPRYELPGDAVHIVLYPAVGDKPTVDETDEVPIVRRGSVLAPEVVEAVTDEDEPPVLTATGLETMAQAVNGIGTYEPGEYATSETTIQGKERAVNAMANIQKERDDLLSQQGKKLHGLLPGVLSQLRTIVLTGVPCNDKSGVVDFLVGFVRACASEAAIAELQAGRETAALKVSRLSHPEMMKRGARDIFGLQRIILEMGPQGSPSTSLEPNSLRTPITPHRSFRTKSSTEDADSEALWSAQENDFSFFDDDEECGLPSKERLHFPLSTLSEKVVMPADDDALSPLPTLQNPPTTDAGTDVVQELTKFRKDRKAAYEGALSLGTRQVDGYWPGEVKIVRWNARGNNRADYYGNIYDQGIYR